MNKEKCYLSDGKTYWEYTSLLEIFSYKILPKDVCLPVIGHNFNDTYCETLYNVPFGLSWQSPKLVKVSYVVYDYLWRVVRKETIEEALSKRVPTCNFGNYCCNCINYRGFRNGPVPHTGIGRYHFGNYYRRMRTTQEHRYNQAHKEFTRGKRRNIPESWDDWSRSDCRIKHSWKKQKKRKQWM